MQCRRADAPKSTTIAASVAYATDESGSDAKTGSARNFERSVSSIWSLAIGRPTRIRFTAPSCSARIVDGTPCEIAQNAAALFRGS